VVFDDFLGKVDRLDLADGIRPFAPVEHHLALEKVNQGVLTVRIMYKPANQECPPEHRHVLSNVSYNANDHDRNKFIKINSFIVINTTWFNYKPTGDVEHNSDTNHKLPDGVNEKCAWTKWSQLVAFPYSQEYAFITSITLHTSNSTCY